MAKSEPMTAEKLKAMGMVEVAPGVYEKQSFKKDSYEDLIRLREVPIRSYISIPGIIPGLNGDKGLMRSHWSGIKKAKALYCSIIRDHLSEGKCRKHAGTVRVTYIGHKSILMDWDNYSSSFKHIGDSLKDEGIILDDKPSIVVEFVPKQVKCKRSEQKVEIIIEDLT